MKSSLCFFSLSALLDRDFPKYMGPKGKSTYFPVFAEGLPACVCGTPSVVHQAVFKSPVEVFNRSFRFLQWYLVLWCGLILEYYIILNRIKGSFYITASCLALAFSFPLCCFPESLSLQLLFLLVGVVIVGGRTGHSLMFLLRLIIRVGSSQEF